MSVRFGTHPQRQRGFDRMVADLVEAGVPYERARAAARKAALSHERRGKPLPKEQQE